MKTYILTFQCGVYYSTANSEKEAILKVGRGEPATISTLDNRELIIKDKVVAIKKLISELEELTAGNFKHSGG